VSREASLWVKVWTSVGLVVDHRDATKIKGMHHALYATPFILGYLLWVVPIAPIYKDWYAIIVTFVVFFVMEMYQESNMLEQRREHIKNQGGSPAMAKIHTYEPWHWSALRHQDYALPTVAALLLVYFIRLIAWRLQL